MNKTALTTAVSAALVASAATLPQASAHVLLPYVVKDANRTTVVTLIAGYFYSSNGNGNVHLQYWTKSTTDANTAACSPSSVTVPMTHDDIMTFDTAGLLGYPLFGDTTNPAPLGMAISYSAPRHGYLVAEFQSGFAEGGYWLELDLANGGAHGAMGLRNFAQFWNAEGDFAYGTGFQSYYAPLSNVEWFEPAHGLTWSHAVNFWPTSVASTVFTVTPLGTEMITKENNQVIMQVINANEVQGAYDRNENGVDGTVPITVRCVGRVTPAQLMPGVVANAAWAAQGGWGNLMNWGDNQSNDSAFEQNIFTVDWGNSLITINAPDLPALVYQVDSSSAAGGKFMVNATEIKSFDFAYSFEGGIVP